MGETFVLSLTNPLIRAYFFYASVLVVKMMFMSIYTGANRMSKKVFINPEDAAPMKLKTRTDEGIERIRRAHLNDLENIPIFFVAAFIYLTTNPSVFLATWLLRAFTVARIMHTIVYAVVVIPQPARALSWATAYFITGYMAVNSILYYML